MFMLFEFMFPIIFVMVFGMIIFQFAEAKRLKQNIAEAMA